MYIVFLALRFLRSRLVNLIAVGGVMVGVAVLIVVTSVMDGFRLQVLSTIRGNLSDIIMTPMTPDWEPLPGYQEMDRLLRKDPRVEATAPRIEQMVFYPWRSDRRDVLRAGGWAIFPMRAIGIDFEREKQVTGLGEYMVAANRPDDPFFSPRRIEYDKQGSVIVSRTFAQKYLGVTAGSLKLPRYEDVIQQYANFLRLEREEGESIEAWATRVEQAYDAQSNPFSMLLETDVGIGFLDLDPGGGESSSSGGSFSGKYNAPQLPIAGVYDGKDTSMDVDRVYFDIDNLREIAKIKDAYHSIRVKLKDPDEARAVKQDFKNRYPEFLTTIWEDHRIDFVKAVNNEKVLLAIVLSFIVLLGGFIILATLTLTVVEKTKDIGVIAALGATRRGILALFVGNGILIGIVGSVLGIGLGRLFVDNANGIKDFLDEKMNIQIFPADIYLFREIPTVWDWNVVLWIVGGSIITAFVAGLIPAWRAARMDPVKAFRYE